LSGLFRRPPPGPARRQLGDPAVDPARQQPQLVRARDPPDPGRLPVRRERVARLSRFFQDTPARGGRRAARSPTTAPSTEITTITGGVMNRATAPRRASAVQGFRLTQFDVPSDGAADVIDGLRSTPKTLPSRFFYDD